MKNFILGTAGHIDHGKTKLVEALTGINCDTHAEEKKRGITINLGFSFIEPEPGLIIGIVDVPGHRDFINTMVAGASGIDLVLLVIAADDGVMPQTKEHVEIIKLLGIKKGLVALTKTDLVDKQLLQLARTDIEEFLVNIGLPGFPVIAVSSKTGEGIESLKNEIAKIASETECRQSGYKFRMYIDRLFTVKGFGQVVTGSVISGELSTGDELKLEPGGKKLKVRRIEQHREVTDKIFCGSRASLNLTGLEKSDLKNGSQLTRMGQTTTQLVDAKLYLFQGDAKLTIWSQVIFLSGTYKSEAKIHLINSNKLSGGEEGLVQIHLPEPAPLLYGDRFIVRNSSGTCTIGGGEIFDTAPDLHKRRPAKLIARLEEIAAGGLPAALCYYLHKAVLTDVEKIWIEFNLKPEELKNIFRKELKQQLKKVLINERDYLISILQLEKIYKLIEKFLNKYHKLNDLDEGGLKTGELLKRLTEKRIRLSENNLSTILKVFEKDGKIKKVRDTWAAPNHSVYFSEEQNKKIRRTEEFFRNQKLHTPLLSEIESEVKKYKVQGQELNNILKYLVRSGKLYRLEGNYIHYSVIEQCRNSLLEYLNNDNTGISVASFRDLVKGNRKTCLLLLHQYESEGLIYREGDLRFMTSKGENIFANKFCETQ